MNKVRMMTKFDYRTMKYLNLYLMKHKRKTTLLYIIMIVLSLGAGAYLFISSLQSEQGPNYIWPVAFALIAAYTVYQMLSIEKNLDRHLRNYFATRPLLTEEIELDSEKITITVCTRPNKPVDYDWAYVSEIVELPQFYLLFMSNNTPIILEKKFDCVLEGDLEELKALITEKSATKPYRLIDKEIVKKPIPEINYIDPVIEEEPEENKEAIDIEGEEVSEEAELPLDTQEAKEEIKEEKTEE